MTNQNLERLCRLAQLDNRYRAEVEAIFIEEGFSQVKSSWSRHDPSYFKRVGEEEATYILLEGIAQNKKFRGTYALTLPSAEGEHFEALMDDTNCRLGPLLNPGLLLLGIGAFFYSLTSGGRIERRALKELKETYLPKSDYSDTPFDYEIIRETLEEKDDQKRVHRNNGGLEQ